MGLEVFFWRNERAGLAWRARFYEHGKLCGVVKEDGLWTILVIVYLTNSEQDWQWGPHRTCTEDASVAFVKDEDFLCVVRWPNLTETKTAVLRGFFLFVRRQESCMFQ